MVRMVEAIIKRRQPGDTALNILDEACGPHRNCDAEFDDDRDPGTPFGDLLIEAFAPGEAFNIWETLEPDGGHTKKESERAAGEVDRWWELVIDPFNERYEFW